MNKKVLSLLLIFSLVFTPVLVRAEGSNEIKPVVDLTVEDKGDNTFEFELHLSTGTVKKGDFFKLGIPDALAQGVRLNETEHYKVERINNSNEFRVIAKEDYDSTTFGLKIKKALIEKVDNFTINEIEIEFPKEFPNYDSGGEIPPTSGEREQYYKIGYEQGGKLVWEAHYRNDSGRDMENLTIVDELGEGQMLDITGEEVLEVSIYQPGQEHGYSVKLTEEGEVTGEDGKQFKLAKVDNVGFILEVSKLSPGESVYLKYKSVPTNKLRETYSNSIQINGQKKAETIKITSSNWSDGDIKQTQKVEVKKVWKPKTKNQEKEIQVQLLKDGQNYGEPFTLSEANGWKKEFFEMPIGDYTAKEITEFDNMEVEIQVDSKDSLTEITIINTEIDPELPQVGEKFNYAAGIGIPLLLVAGIYLITKKD